MTDQSFDGFITPEGEKIPVDDALRMIPMAEDRIRDRKELLGFLMSLGRRCASMERFVNFN